MPWEKIIIIKNRELKFYPQNKKVINKKEEINADHIYIF